MTQPPNNLGDLWWYLRKKSRWNPGRSIMRIEGAEMVREVVSVSPGPPAPVPAPEPPPPAAAVAEPMQVPPVKAKK